MSLASRTRTPSENPRRGSAGDWEKNLKEAQANLKERFGDYELIDFSFTFVGDKEQGKVTLSHKGKEVFPLYVIKEGDEWKLAQR